MKNSSIFKLLTLMLAVLIVAAAIGCGKGEEQKPTPQPVPPATSSPTATTPAGESGTLSDIEGEVQVQRSGASAWAAATNGMKIWTGDGLKTGSDGYTLITFFDGSVMEVNPGTEISVTELSQAAGGSTTVQISQTIGNTLNRVQNLVDSSSTYEVTTPAGSAVVRGTIYSVDVNDGGTLTTCVETKDENDTIEHSVAFSNAGSAVNVIENFVCCAVVGGAPGAPTHADPNSDPATFESGGSTGTSCPSECWIGEGDFRMCICDCCCPSSCSLFEGGLLNGYGDGLYGGQIEGICVCPCGQGLCLHGVETCCHGEGYYCALSCQPEPDPSPTGGF